MTGDGLSMYYKFIATKGLPDWQNPFWLLPTIKTPNSNCKSPFQMTPIIEISGPMWRGAAAVVPPTELCGPYCIPPNPAPYCCWAVVPTDGNEFTVRLLPILSSTLMIILWGRVRPPFRTPKAEQLRQTKKVERASHLQGTPVPQFDLPRHDDAEHPDQGPLGQEGGQRVIIAQVTHRLDAEVTCLRGAGRAVSERLLRQAPLRRLACPDKRMPRQWPSLPPTPSTTQAPTRIICTVRRLRKLMGNGTKLGDVQIRTAAGNAAWHWLWMRMALALDAQWCRTRQVGGPKSIFQTPTAC